MLALSRPPSAPWIEFGIGSQWIRKVHYELAKTKRHEAICFFASDRS